MSRRGGACLLTPAPPRHPTQEPSDLMRFRTLETRLLRTRTVDAAHAPRTPDAPRTPVPAPAPVYGPVASAWACPPIDYGAYELPPDEPQQEEPART